MTRGTCAPVRFCHLAFAAALLVAGMACAQDYDLVLRDFEEGQEAKGVGADCKIATRGCKSKFCLKSKTPEE